MVVWGRGLLQSDDDYQIADELSAMFGRELLYPGKEHDKEGTIKMMNDGLLSQKFEKILSADFKPPLSHQKRERFVIILGLLAMELGARIEDRHMMALRVLRPMLPTIEQQVQLVTALDEYKNDGTPWQSGSKGLFDREDARKLGKTQFDLGDEFWFGGLGNSADEAPPSTMLSKVCFSCGEKGDNLLRCSRCKMACYCNATCQRIDWPIHKRACEARDSVRVCPVPDVKLLRAAGLILQPASSEQEDAEQLDSNQSDSSQSDSNGESE
ncbi:hypothetical protein F5Y04DRAFT_287133 [Hypomontagnella monticulosa]|nr:hypothetical protein F5Y04DRAFT_287133 [Hypomontagnella monticulosa]